MKKLVQFIFVIILLSTSILTSQVRRIALIEEQTNAGCGPCASANPIFQSFFEESFGGVLSVRYHTPGPGTDSMYILNTTDNNNRTGYYGVGTVPHYWVDGTSHGVPSNKTALFKQMIDRLELKSPVKIYVEATVTNDSVYGQVSIKAFNNVTQTILRLRIAVIERMKVYSSPPGSNGEKIFPDVMRKMVPDGNGTSIASISNGDSLSFYFSTPTNVQWNVNDLAVVAFLQSDATKEVIQSNINLPTCVIESQTGMVDLVELNQSYTKLFNIDNDNLDTLKIKLKINGAQLPGDWTYNLVYNGTNYDSIDVSIAPGESLSFNVVVNTGSTPSTGQSNINIFAQLLDDPYNYGFTFNYFMIQKMGDILVVDADGGRTGQATYVNSISNAGQDVTVIDQRVVQLVPDIIANMNFESIFWANGWTFPAFILADVQFLKDYLDNGGNLFIGGQDIGWDIFDPSGSSTFQEAKDFYNMYMDARYISDDSEISSGEGIPGTLGDGISFNINPISGALYPEVISSYGGMGDSLFFYTGTTMVGALAYEGATFKSVYLGIGLEQVSDAAARDTLVTRALRWFAQPIVNVDDEAGTLPVSFQLEQNFPNPFNPTTKITYKVPQISQVIIKLFDILGNEIAVLVDETKIPGNFEVTFDATNIASGVYLYQMIAGNYVSVKKMTILK